MTIAKLEPVHTRGVPVGLQASAGSRFGRWVVVEGHPMMQRLPAMRRGRLIQRYFYFTLCRCDCGTEAWVSLSSLVIGSSKSCGCLSHDLFKSRSVTHGKSKSPIYKVWKSMLTRMFYKSSGCYHRYEGRGLTMDSRWKNFEDFYSDMGDPPFEGATLERVDNSVGYWPKNVVWATRKQQARNMDSNVRYELNGRSLTLSEWEEITGIKRGTLESRIKDYGWTVEEALTSPVSRVVRKKRRSPQKEPTTV